MEIKYKKISVPEYIHEKLKDDRDLFELSIGGGRWSIGHVIAEYYKIMGKSKPIFYIGKKEVSWSEVKKNKEKWVPLIKEHQLKVDLGL